MLQLKDIVKTYGSGENAVTALNGVSITFRENEFVAILGHSGCGKTTMLNIIGGLDHYTTGDLIINGISTKKYKDRDWDAYRNHSIGFIFQSYNLIPHQTVLSNVELALTISGVSKGERRKRAKEALEKVGLGNQLHKKPNQMSGGQMQRVAIARALINDPDILLADEPTGALDSETSIQVMELLKEIAKDKLVIMVTHNPELADQYATRIVRIKDGQLTADSDPYTPEKEDKPKEAKKQRVSMSFPTAVSLSLNNLMTKKGRTLLTAFAGSIGIIGIALILSLSTGINEYIEQVQEETLSSYPITITREYTDTGSVLSAMMGESEKDEKTGDDPNTVYANTAMYDMMNTINGSAKQINNMKDFKKFVDSSQEIKDNTNAVAYSYNIQMPIYTKDETGEIVKCDLNELYFDALGFDVTANENMGYSTMMNNSSMMDWGKIWVELLPDETGKDINQLIYDQYDLVYGEWPKEYNEVVVVLNTDNEIPDFITYALGIKPKKEFANILFTAMKGENIENYGSTSWKFDELMAQDYKLILPCEYYTESSTGLGYTDLSKNASSLDMLYEDENVGTELKIVGFIRQNPDATVTMLNGYLGYTKELTDYIINKTNESLLVQSQVGNKEIDVLTGKRFLTDELRTLKDEDKAAEVEKYIANADTETKAGLASAILLQIPQDELAARLASQKNSTRNEILERIDKITAAMSDPAIQEMIGGSEGSIAGKEIVDMLNSLSDDDFNKQKTSILSAIIPFEYAIEKMPELAAYTPDELAAELDKAEISESTAMMLYDEVVSKDYSKQSYEDVIALLGYADEADPSTIYIYAKSFESKDNVADAIDDYNSGVSEDDEIKYTDFVGLLMSSITGIISGISYLLIAFVGISLVVSSIMIGIITYISVLERTREIGILRAIGASKHDVSTVFNAETLLVGLAAGLIGIGVSVLLTIPINLIIHHLTSLDTLRAHVPVTGAIILIVISMALTLIAGLIPARVASKKDPVEALRSE